MEERTLKKRTVFQGKVLAVEVHEIELPGGRGSTREIVRHGGAVGVLVRRPDGVYVLVRQYRKAVESVLLEIVAGSLEPGEKPEACAIREVREESGYEVEDLRPLGVIVLAPGYSSERLHLYTARVRADRKAPLPDVDESLETVFLTAEELDRSIRRGEIVDAKTLAAWQLAGKESHHERET